MENNRVQNGEFVNFRIMIFTHCDEEILATGGK